MPIKASCTCGAAFSARDDLAGRTVACPKCKQPLTIPAPQPAAPAAPHANADLFDGLGLTARDSNQPRCPGCGVDMAPNAVLCIKCGYNTKTGKRMQTISMSGETAAPTGGGHGAHGGATAMLMARAAQAAEEDELAERTKTKEGMPLWVLIVGLFACILFGVVMSLIPQATALGGTGAIMVFAAYLMQIYAWVGTMVAAGKVNPLYPLGIFFGDIFLAIALELLGWLLSWMLETNVIPFTRLFAGIVWLTYAYLHSDECGQYIMFFWLSKAVAFVGSVLIVIAFIIFVMEQKEGVGQLTPPPADPMPVMLLT